MAQEEYGLLAPLFAPQPLRLHLSLQSALVITPAGQRRLLGKDTHYAAAGDLLARGIAFPHQINPGTTEETTIYGLSMTQEAVSAILYGDAFCQQQSNGTWTAGPVEWGHA